MKKKVEKESLILIYLPVIKLFSQNIIENLFSNIQLYVETINFIPCFSTYFFKRLHWFIDYILEHLENRYKNNMIGIINIQKVGTSVYNTDNKLIDSMPKRLFFSNNWIFIITNVERNKFNNIFNSINDNFYIILIIKQTYFKWNIKSVDSRKNFPREPRTIRHPIQFRHRKSFHDEDFNIAIVASNIQQLPSPTILVSRETSN